MATNNNGGEFQEYQAAQNQLLNIRAQQEKNLSEQRIMNQAAASTNGVLSQAAELMAQQPTTEAANFNPQTQAILSQYGLNQPRIQKSNSTQRSTQQVSKQNIVINNNYKTENTTTNNVTVPSGGPMQGRPVQINTEGKLKTWLSGVFAQQNEAAAKRDRDYEIRQANLTKDTNKLMRKLEGVGTRVGQALDPKRLAQATINPLKGILITLGIVKIGENIEGIMDKVDDIQNFFTEGGLVEALGGKKGEENAFQALGNLLFSEKDGLWGHVKEYFTKKMDERRAAIKNVPKPEKNWLGLPTIEGTGKYISDIIKAAIDPETSVENVSSKKVSDDVIDTNSQEYREQHRTRGDSTKGGGVYSDYTLYDKNNNKTGVVDRGDFAIVEGTYKGVPEYHLNSNGQLTGTAGSTVSQSNDIIRLLSEAEKGKYVSSMAVVEGLSRIENVLQSNRNKEVVVSDSFIDTIKRLFNIKDNLGKKINPGDYLYVPRKIKKLQKGEKSSGREALELIAGRAGKWIADAVVNDGRIELVKKSELESGDQPLDKLPENLTVLKEQDIQKITKAIIGENANDYSAKNTNSELQHAVLDYFGEHFKNSNATDGLELGTFESNTMGIGAFSDLQKEHKEELDEFYNNSRHKIVVDKAKNLAKDISTTAKEKISGVQEIFTDTESSQEGDIPMGLRAAYAIKFFEDRLGLTYEQAAALVANIKAESEFKPYAYNPKGKGGGAEGLLQWTGDGNRKQKVLELFNKEHPEKKYKSIRKMTFPDQLEMISLEMEKGESLGNGKFLQNLREGKFDKFSTNIVDTFIRGMVVSGSGGKMASREQTEDYENNFKKRTDIYTALVQKYSNNKSLNSQATFTPNTDINNSDYSLANNNVSSNDYLPTNINASSSEIAASEIKSELSSTKDVVINSTAALGAAIVGSIENIGVVLGETIAMNNNNQTSSRDQASSFTNTNG